MSEGVWGGAFEASGIGLHCGSGSGVPFRVFYV